MDRVIKFRAWDAIQKKMYYQEKCFPFTLITQYGLYKLDPMQKEDNYQKITFRDFTLSQFTGLHDKNGKVIYEHDFVKVANNVIYEVIFIDADIDNELFSQFAIRCASRDLTIGFDSYCIDKMEVIGNRLESPELCE